MGSTETIQTLKNSQRLQALEARRSIPPADRSRRSAEIWSHLTGLPEFSSADIIGGFLSFGEEVETTERVRGLLEGGRRVAVPVMAPPGGEPSFSELRSWTDLATNSFGILEPRKDCYRAVPHSSIPFYFIPGVAFDLRGSRLGYGIGFYDLVLRDVSPEALIAGLAFEAQIVDHVPVLPHDHPVDVIVTEERIVKTPVRRGSIEEVC
jgi:5-formyltetrahydrofolate cyclo-ligase